MSQDKTGRLPLIGGAWVDNLTVQEPFRTYFLGAVMVALCFAWKKIYRVVDACIPGSLCATLQTNRTYKVLFWAVVALVALALVFPCETAS